MVRHWTFLGRAEIPGGQGHLELHRGKDDYFIHTSRGAELMNSRKHASESALGTMVCEGLQSRPNARVLIGGLGMGFTLATALEALGPDAEVTVAELLPDVVEWNRGELGDCAGRPLEDPRAQVYEGDVADLLRDHTAHWDGIALDVDNGPEGLTQDDNDWLYGPRGLAAVRQALRPGGRVGFWSAHPDRAFPKRLANCGFKVEERRVYAHGKKGTRHTLWFGT